MTNRSVYATAHDEAEAPWTRSPSTARSAEAGENRAVQASEHLRRIEDYALLGDLQTAALIDRSGSIDWCCFPRFDSRACFAALLGGPENGRWSVAPPAQITRHERRYRHDTLILESVFETAQGRGRA